MRLPENTLPLWMPLILCLDSVRNSSFHQRRISHQRSWRSLVRTPYIVITSLPANYTRPLTRLLHLFLRQLSRSSAQSYCQISRSASGYVGIDRCQWPFHQHRGLPARSVVGAGRPGRTLNVEACRRGTRRGHGHGYSDGQFTSIDGELLQAYTH